MSLTQEQINCLQLVKEETIINYKICCNDEIANLLGSLVTLKLLKETVRYIRPRGRVWLEYSLTPLGQDALNASLIMSVGNIALFEEVQPTSAQNAQVEASLKEADHA